MEKHTALLLTCYSNYQNSKTNHTKYLILEWITPFCSLTNKLVSIIRLNFIPSNALSHCRMRFCIITLDSRREEPSWGALIAEVTVWEWLMNKAEISCFLSRALKQMSHSGNFPFSINGKAQLAREKWLWVSCREEEEETELLESLRYSQRALKVSNDKSNQFIFIPLYELWGSILSFCYVYLIRTQGRPNGNPLTECVF